MLSLPYLLLLLLSMIILITGLTSDHPFQVNYKVRQVLLQSATAYFITKCNSFFYYKVRQNMAREIEKSLLITNLVKLADELRMNPNTCGLANLN